MVDVDSRLFKRLCDCHGRVVLVGISHLAGIAHSRRALKLADAELAAAEKEIKQDLKLKRPIDEAAIQTRIDELKQRHKRNA